MDSTLIQCEVVDELAREKGVYSDIAAITLSAMQGKIDFNESLKQRCEKLAGLTKEALQRVVDRVQLTPGAEELIQTLKAYGYKTALISGGFTFVSEGLKRQLGLDYAFANTLEIENGALTGKVIPPIINAQRKAQLLEEIASREKIPLAETIAVGDGANDLLMLGKAGFSIAFNAKPAVQAQADAVINENDLYLITSLLGVEKAAAKPPVSVPPVS